MAKKPTSTAGAAESAAEEIAKDTSAAPAQKETKAEKTEAPAPKNQIAEKAEAKSEAAPAKKPSRKKDDAKDSAPEATGPVSDEPTPEAPPKAKRVRKADMAATLPLQAEAELDELDKAEGFRHLGLNDQILADLHSIGFLSHHRFKTKRSPSSCRAAT